MHCNRCGTKNPEGSEHCFNCGASMNQPPQPDGVVPPGSGVTAQKATATNVLARIDIAGTSLVITEREVSFGSQVLRCDEVVGIRYGIYKHYFNGIRTSQSYGIWLTDGRSTMSIECAAGFFVLSSTIEARYQQALKALYSAVMVPLIQSFLVNLDKGPGFQIGGVTLDKTGLHRSSSLGSIQKGILGAWASIAGGRSVEEREHRHQHLPWAEFGGHSFGKGQVYLFRNKESWVQFALRDTWNAVCLGPLFDFLNEDGRLWQFVQKEPEAAKLGRILIVDDEEEIREIIASMLRAAGYECQAFAGGLEALALLEAGEEFQLLITDILNTPLTGFDLLLRAKQQFPNVAVLIASAVHDEDLIRQCLQNGALDYLKEPFEREQLLATVRRALEQQRAVKQ